MTRYHATVEGEIAFTPEEEAERDAEEAAEAALKPTQDIKDQIIAIERQCTERRKREAILGIDGGWLVGLDAQIVKLREKLRL